MGKPRVALALAAALALLLSCSDVVVRAQDTERIEGMPQFIRAIRQIKMLPFSVQLLVLSSLCLHFARRMFRAFARLLQQMLALLGSVDLRISVTLWSPGSDSGPGKARPNPAD
jgi:hypothetical protein